MIVALDAPDFRTISDFRKRHLKALGELFLQVLKLCETAGLVKLGHVALDGTKIKANASKHKAMSYERMKKREAELKAEVACMLAAAEAADAQEDETFGKDKRGDEMPDWASDKEKRLAKIQEAMAALEAEAKLAAEEERRIEAEKEQQRNAEGRKKPGKPARRPLADRGSPSGPGSATRHPPLLHRRSGSSEPLGGNIRALLRLWFGLSGCSHQSSLVNGRKNFRQRCQRLAERTIQLAKDQDHSLCITVQTIILSASAIA